MTPVSWDGPSIVVAAAEMTAPTARNSREGDHERAGHRIPRPLHRRPVVRIMPGVEWAGAEVGGHHRRPLILTTGPSRRKNAARTKSTTSPIVPSKSTSLPIQPSTPFALLPPTRRLDLSLRTGASSPSGVPGPREQERLGGRVHGLTDQSSDAAYGRELLREPT